MHYFASPFVERRNRVPNTNVFDSLIPNHSSGRETFVEDHPLRVPDKFDRTRIVHFQTGYESLKCCAGEPVRRSEPPVKDQSGGRYVKPVLLVPQVVPIRGLTGERRTMNHEEPTTGMRAHRSYGYFGFSGSSAKTQNPDRLLAHCIDSLPLVAAQPR